MLTRLEISLGDSLPRLSVSDRRMSTVEDATKSMVELLEGKGVDVAFEMVSGTHFSPLAPKFDSALENLLPEHADSEVSSSSEGPVSE